MLIAWLFGVSGMLLKSVLIISRNNIKIHTEKREIQGAGLIFTRNGRYRYLIKNNNKKFSEVLLEKGNNRKYEN